MTAFTQMFQMISQNFTIVIFMAQNYIKTQTVSVILKVNRLIFLQHNLKRKTWFGVKNMYSLNLVDTIKSTLNAKIALVFVVSFVLTACGGGAGGEDVLVDSANVGSQTSTDEVTQDIPATVDAVQISTQPHSITRNKGETASFSVSASGGGSLSFQWMKNQQSIQGATNNTLVLSDISASDAALYSVVVSNSAGFENSLSAQLTVNVPVVDPVVDPVVNPVVILSQPQALTVEENTAASFDVQVTGDGDISYQWLKDGDAINGATSPSFSLDSVTLSDAGVYSVIVTSSQGPVISDAAPLSVTAIQVASSTIELTWDIPQAREDGSDLALYEINGYVIAYGTDQDNLSNQLSVDGASSTITMLENLASGTYYFAIATVDSDGVQGEYSSIIQQSI